MAITTSIKNYPVGHQSGQGGGGGVTYYYGSGGTNNSRVITTGTINATTGNIDDISGKTLNYNEGSFLTVTAADGTITTIRGTELNYEKGYIGDLTSDNIDTNTLTVHGNADIEQAWIKSLSSHDITTEFLTVTKQAHFFELIIDKIKSVGGTIILTPTNCIADYVKEVKVNGATVAYDVFFRSTDGNGHKVDQGWWKYDQAICQNFTGVQTGLNSNVSNKYYWRLVEDILEPRYMNLNTGAQTTDPLTATYNAVRISNPGVQVTNNDNLVDVNIGWQTTPQDLSVTWDELSGGAQAATVGTMKTTNTIYGIQMIPVNGTQVTKIFPERFVFNCSGARLNIGIIFEDDSSIYFPAPPTPGTQYACQLNTNAPVSKVIITNADDVLWHHVYGIRLSNTDKASSLVDNPPEAGDNIVQLGYRYDMYEPDDPEYDEKRASAIIISAYQTPDAGIQAPSYAQYQNITYYDLSSYRKSYIDAHGAAFYGNVFNGNGTPLADLIGDREEYIYKGFQSQQTWDPNDDNPAFWGPQQVDTFLGPQGHQWNNLPNGVNANIQYEYAAVRTKHNNVWSQYHAPYVSSVWGGGAVGPQGPQGDAGQNGSQGAQGAQGNKGEDGAGAITYELVDYGTQAFYGMTLEENTNNLKYSFTVAPRFKVIKTENGESTYLTFDEATYFPTEIGDDRNGLCMYVGIDTAYANPNSDIIYRQANLSRQGSQDAIYSYAYSVESVPNSTPLSPGKLYGHQMENLISKNKTIDIRLIPYADGEFQANGSQARNILQYTLDNNTIFMGLAPAAALNVVQGTNASIKSLVTGYQTINNELNGSQGIQNRLSLVEQTASGIQTTVAALTTTTSGARNLIMNGAFKQATPTQYWSNWDSPSGPSTREIITDTSGTKWMHIESTNSRYEGYKQNHGTDYNIKIEAGQTYTVSLRARAYQGTAKICVILHYYYNNIALYERNSSNHIQTPHDWEITSTDTPYTYTFTVPEKGYLQNSSTSRTVNAFDIMVGDNTTDVQDFYITDITLVKGSIPAAWSPAPEETDAALNGLTTEVTRISVQANGIQSDVTREFQNMSLGGANLINGTQTLNSAYTLTYGTPSLSNGISSEGLYGVIGSSTGSDVDLIKYYDDEEIAVQADTEYVMSFWAKGTGHLRTFFRSRAGNNPPMVVRPYFYNEGPQGTNGFSNDGMAEFTLTSNWKRYWIKYKTLASLPTPTAYIIFGRVYESGKTAYVCGPKLEEGNIPGEWEPSVFDGHQFTSSTIKQTADEILLQVGYCGIDIDNERIELNGDTKVNGQITMTDEYQGFILSGTQTLSGVQTTTHISPKSIGTYNSFISGTSIDTTQSRQTTVEYPTNTQSAQSASMIDSFGQFITNTSSPTTITISAQTFTFRGYNSGTILTPDSCSTNYKFYINGSLDGERTYSGISPSNFTYTPRNSGNLSVMCITTANFTRPNIAQYGYKVIFAQSYHINIPNQSYSLIGPDGIGLALGSGNIVYLGNSGAYFKYDNNILRITASNGIQASSNNGSTYRNL